MISLIFSSVVSNLLLIPYLFHFKHFLIFRILLNLLYIFHVSPHYAHAVFYTVYTVYVKNTNVNVPISHLLCHSWICCYWLICYSLLWVLFLCILHIIIFWRPDILNAAFFYSFKYVWSLLGDPVKFLGNNFIILRIVNFARGVGSNLQFRTNLATLLKLHCSIYQWFLWLWIVSSHTYTYWYSAADSWEKCWRPLELTVWISLSSTEPSPL